MPRLAILIAGTHQQIAVRMNVEGYFIVGNFFVWEMSN